jgi:hypothetical protein
MEVVFVLVTRLAYSGSQCSLLSFWPGADGVRVRIDRWPENGDPYRVDEFVMSLPEFREMVAGLTAASVADVPEHLRGEGSGREVRG